MTPEAFRSGLLEIAGRLAQAVVGYVRMLPANPSDDAWQTFLDTVYPELMSARRAAYLLARDFYAAQRAPRAEEPPPEMAERSYPIRILDRTLTDVTRARLEGAEDDADVDREMIVSETLSTLERHAMASGRDYVTDAVGRDPVALAYARVPSGSETCAFCTMLVSRGPVYERPGSGTRYTSENGRTFTSGAGGNEPYHNNCDCVVVPVFNRDDWPGRNQYLDADRFYRESTRKHPGVSALRALRMELDSESSE